jgi:hypothetical protein
MQQFRFIGPFNQLYMFRQLITPILRSIWPYLQFLVWYTDDAVKVELIYTLTVSPVGSNVGVLYQKL